jgi:hypothetical protein
MQQLHPLVDDPVVHHSVTSEASRESNWQVWANFGRLNSQSFPPIPGMTMSVNIS